MLVKTSTRFGIHAFRRLIEEQNLTWARQCTGCKQPLDLTFTERPGLGIKGDITFSEQFVRGLDLEIWISGRLQFEALPDSWGAWNSGVFTDPTDDASEAIRQCAGWEPEETGLAGGRLNRAVQEPHQGGLTGAVFAKKNQNHTWFGSE